MAHDPAALAAAPARPFPVMATTHLLVVYVVWGSTYLAVKICLSGSDAATPVQLQAARLTCAAVLLALFAWRTTGWPRELTLSMVLMAALSGILLWVFGNGMATLAAKDASSSFIVMCMGLIPLWTVAIECLIQRQRPSRTVLLGLLLGFAGLVVMVMPTMDPATGAAIVRPGHEWQVLLFLLTGGICWALGTAVQKRQKSTLPIAWLATLQMGGAALVLLLLALAEQAPLPHAPDAAQLLAFGFLVIFGSIVAMISFQKVVRHFTPAVAATFAYVNPLVGMLLGAWVLDETIHRLSVAGFCVILLGLWLVMRAPATKAISTQT